MAHLDLEEQEQVAQFKYFWAQYGNLISWLVIAVLMALAGWNGWNWYQRSQAAKAAAVYDELERSVFSKDAGRIEAVFGKVKSDFSGTVVAAQGGLLVAQALDEQAKPVEARAALAWVEQSAPDDAYRSVARLRMAAMDIESKNYDQALKTLEGKMAESFEPLAADRRGDVYLAQGKAEEAKTQYLAAWKAFGDRADYRRLVEIKLNSLGVAAPKADKAEAAS